MSAALQFLPLESLASPATSPRASSDAESIYTDDDTSIGHYDNIVPHVPLAKPVAVLPTTTSAAATSTTRKTSPISREQKVKLLADVLAFLPLEDIEAARHALPEFAEAADMIAPKPLGDDNVVFVRWEPQALHTAMQPAVLMMHTRHGNHGRSAPTLAPAIFPWRCLACGTVTSGPRQCGTCHAALANSACRVFLGQLRKELTAELCMAMVRTLLPDVNILHMESHTNTDGRGKGCAWAYVDSVEDAMRVVELHKRVFVDLDGEGAEGYWYVKDAALIQQLGEMAESLSSARGRPLWLPRQALVAELPGKSMLAEYVRSLSRHQ